MDGADVGRSAESETELDGWGRHDDYQVGLLLLVARAREGVDAGCTSAEANRIDLKQIRSHTVDCEFITNEC